MNLTLPEKAVLERLMLGWTNRTIAEDLRTTEGVIKNRCWTLYEKIGAETRLQAALLGKDHPEWLE